LSATNNIALYRKIFQITHQVSHNIIVCNYAEKYEYHCS
jgi:hypothetical protein